MSNPVIVLGMPHRGSIRKAATARAFFESTPAQRKRFSMLRVDASGTILTENFNRIWATMLNTRQTHGATHFVMMHDDVVPKGEWLETLMDELETSGADILSAVIPIKDELGLTSTGISVQDVKQLPRRLTMTEACELPITFGADEIQENAKLINMHLLINTGLWICKLGDWCERICFHTIDWMTKTAEGKYKTRTVPEDWCFSWDASRLGLNVKATRAVNLYHEEPWWRNDQPWGVWHRDEQYYASLATLPMSINKPKSDALLVTEATAEDFAEIAWGST